MAGYTAYPYDKCLYKRAHLKQSAVNIRFRAAANGKNAFLRQVCPVNRYAMKRRAVRAAIRGTLMLQLLAILMNIDQS
jgi:hypothetical protein